MVVENPTWGAPRIHGELLMLGFDVSERTISRWMKRAPRDPEPAKRWLTFLRNLDLLRDSSSLIVMPSMDWKSPRRFDPLWGVLAALRSKGLGRMGSHGR